MIGGLVRLSVDPPWEWSWQRRTGMVVLILTMSWILVATVSDLRNGSYAPYKIVTHLAGTWFSSVVVAAMIAMAVAGLLRLLLWVFP